MKFKLLLGGPGTGKTEHLVRLVEERLAGGLRPDEVAFVAFTKAAAEEAAARAATALSVSRRSLTHFRTLHSLCFRELGLRRGDVLEGPSLRELEKLTGEKEARDRNSGEIGPWEVEQLARSTGEDVEQLAMRLGVGLPRLHRAIAARREFKERRGLLDFTDMLDRATQVKPLSGLKLAIIDEAQDLTPLQWKVARHLFKDVPQVIVAGDDDQAIHEWAGSTIEPMLAHRGEVEALSLSHRLPRQVHALAGRALSRLSSRLRKDTTPADRDGEVRWYGNPEEVDLRQPGKWLLLARARYQLNELASVARAAGVTYTLAGKSSVNADLLRAAREYEAGPGREKDALRWHDALTNFPLEEREYLLACRRRGEKLNEPPRVTLETVHGAKGRQADNVLLLMDLTARVSRRVLFDPDPETRVLYVGLTRAAQSLHMIQPRSVHGWQL